MPRVFISYSRKESTIAEALCRRLTSDGIDCFFDRESVEPGADWVEALGAALEASQWILLIITRDYLESPWTQQERNVALAVSGPRKPIIQLIRDKSDVPLLLRDVQALYVRSRKSLMPSYQRLIQQLNEPGTSKGDFDLG